MDIFYNLQYYLVFQKAKFGGHPFIIQVTIFFILVLLLFYLFLLVRIFVVNCVRKRFSKTRDNLSNLFADRIKSVLLNVADLDKDELTKRFEDDLYQVKNNRQKRAFTYMLINLKNSPEFKNLKLNVVNYGVVIELFKINEYWDKKLISGNNHSRHRSLRVLDDLENGMSGSNILRSVYHKDDNLRKHARATLIKYDKNDPYKFLEENFDKNFNSLDEVRLHFNLVRISKEQHLPVLMRWVHNSTNIKFKVFIIKEIGFFNQKESGNDLIEFIMEENSILVKCQAIEVLGMLNYVDAEEYLIKKYPMAAVLTQKSIIKTIGMFQTLNGMIFLEKVFNDIHEHDTKILVAKALKNFGTEGRKRLSKLGEHSSAFDKKIFEQVNY